MAAEHRTVIRIPLLLAFAGTTLLWVAIYIAGVSNPLSIEYIPEMPLASTTPPIPVLDILAYNKKMVELAGYGTTTAQTGIIATSSAWLATTTSISSPKHRWPVATVYPAGGAILPFSRIVAYYGNFESTAMGILGQYPADEMIGRLEDVADEWRAADPATPVIPALDYIAVVAQGGAGADGKYRLRMPDSEIEKALDLAKEIHGLVFLDVQPGLSDLPSEVPLLEKYLALPDVELAIDPEFSMKTGARPDTVIGTMSADDVNFAAGYLATIVRKYDLPPKILVVHRFTKNMLTGYSAIQPLPEVEIVVSMDGWSTPERKIGTYNQVVLPEPVQFAGIKLFYKNDSLPPSTGLLTPAQILALKPRPIFVEYQ